MMSSEQVALIKRSWRILRGVQPKLVADLFYTKLFTENRGLRKMFPEDMEQQYTKLMDMLNIIVVRIDSVDTLESSIADLARRHKNYGVKDAHYKLVGEALLWTLEKGLGKDWNEETKNAWSDCYNTLAEMMLHKSTA